MFLFPKRKSPCHHLYCTYRTEKFNHATKHLGVDFGKMGDKGEETSRDNLRKKYILKNGIKAVDKRKTVC